MSRGLRHRVGHVVAIHRGDVSRYGLLLNGVRDVLAVHLHRQLRKAPHPSVCLGHRLLVQRHAVCQQPNDNTIGPNPQRVVIVIPRLGAFDRHGLGRRVRRGRLVAQAVGNHKAFRHIAAHLCHVVGHVVFHNRIRDLLPVLVLGQVHELPRPAVIGRHGTRVNDLHPVCHQMHHDALRALARLVVVVVPRLLTAHGRPFVGGRLQGIGHVQPVVGDLVARERLVARHVLHHAIPIRILVLQLGQALKPPGPVVVGRHFALVHQRVARYQAHHDALRPQARGVVVVVPRLVALKHDVAFAGHVVQRVGNHVLRGACAHNGRTIPRDRALYHVIVDKTFVVVHRQVGKAPPPVIGSRHAHRIYHHVVGEQVHDDAFGPRLRLVVAVVPHLAAAYGGGQVLLVDPVVKVEAVAARGIAVDLLLGYAIDNFLAIKLLGQARKLPRPVTVFVGRHNLAVHDLVVGKQVHGQAPRPLSVGVIVVVPSLRARHANKIFCGNQRVGNGEAVRNRARHLRRVPLNGSFLDAVGVRDPVRLLEKVVETPRPVGCLAGLRVVYLHLYGVALVLEGGIQAHGNRARTRPPRVVVVVPHLATRDRYAVRHVLVNDHKADDRVLFLAAQNLRRAIACVRLLLGHGVRDPPHAVVVGRQLAKVVAPPVRVAHVTLTHFLAVCVQRYVVGVGTNHVDVVKVVPFLVHLDLDQPQRVGNGKALVVPARVVADLARIGLGRVLADAVGNGLAVLVYGQVRKGIRPAILIRQDQLLTRVFWLAVAHALQQVNGNRGMRAARNALVVPHLAHVELCRLGHVRVGNGKDAAARHVLDDAGLVAIHPVLGNRKIRIHQGKVVKAPLPVVVSRHVLAVHDLAGVFPHNMNDHEGRPQTLPVVMVVPHLFAAQLRSRRRMGVDDHKAVGVIRVVVHGVRARPVRSRKRFRRTLDHLVSDFVAIVVELVYAHEHAPPIGAGIKDQRLAPHQLAVCVQVDDRGGRPDAVPVVHVVPQHVNDHVYLARRVGVGKDIAIRGGPAHNGRVLVHVILVHSVDNVLTALLGGQVGKGVPPFVGLV